jgi:hypothetical protein
MFLAHGVIAQGQPTGNIGGTVVDPDNKAVAGATVTITDAVTHASLPSVQTGSAGEFRVSDLPPGNYTITVTMANFKTTILNNIVVTVDHTYEVPVKMEVGAASVSVQVEGGGQQVMETQSTSISNTVSGRSVQELPFASRSAVLLGILDPGVQTSGGPRNSTFEGLPKGTINITFDGINNQCNLLKSSDGYFAINDPRIDDIEEFGITTNANDASKTGEGAAQMSYVSKRGGNAFHGGVWEYNRNTAFDSNYYFNGISGTPRQLLDFNDFGYKIGGPILKDKLFFFTDFDFFQFPQSVTRTKQILTPLAASGTFTYASTAAVPAGNTWTTCNGTTCSANLLALAAAGGIAGSGGVTGPSTISSITGPYINAIESSYTTAGVSSTPFNFYQNNIAWNSTTIGERRYPDLRLDYNITKHHSLEFDYHYAFYISNPDLLNSVDAEYPDSVEEQNHGEQLSNRNLFVLAERWTIGSNKSNEIRAGLNSAPTNFGLGLLVGSQCATPSAALSSFCYPSIPVTVGGSTTSELYTFGISGMSSSPFQSPGGTLGRNTAVGQAHDTFVWTKGTHNLSFGVDYTDIYANDFFTVSGSGAFGLISTDPLVSSGTFGQNNNLPGISGTDLSNAEALYASLVGRLDSYTSAVAFSPLTGGYKSGAPEVDKIGKHEYGIYGQDSWRVKPNLTFNYGLRWEYDGPPFDKYNQYAMLGGTELQASDIWGVSGEGNLFKPGAVGGTSSLFYQNDKGLSWYNKYYRALAPSVGLAWQPNSDNDMLKHIFGGQGKTVIRAGYSIAYSRQGLEDWEEISEDNPGQEGSQVSTATLPGSGANSAANGTFAAGSINLGQLGNTNAIQYTAQTPTSFLSSFPVSPTQGNEVFEINPNIKPPLIQSWQASVQRELSPNMVLEVRYQANHGDGLWDVYNINEVNIFENGFLSEFENAQANLNLCTGNSASCIAAEKDLGILSQASTATTPTSDFANLYASANAACGGATGPGSTGAAASCTTPITGIAGDLSLPILTASFDTLSTTATPLTPQALSAAEISPTIQNNANFHSSSFITDLLAGGAGSLAGSLGSGSSAYNSFVTHLVGAGYPLNFWVVNPTASGGAVTLSNGAQSTYNAAVVDLRRRPSHGLQFDLNYTFSKSLTDYNANSSVSSNAFATLRDTKYGKGPAPFDIPNAVKLQLIYDLPFGQGKKWSSSSGFANRIIGGWSLDTITRWQTGPPILISSGITGGDTFNSSSQGAGVNLVGITVQQLQSMLTTNKLEGGSTPFVYYVPTSLLDSSLQKANTSIIQPENQPGVLGGRPFVYGPEYFRTDLSVVKVTKITERVNFEMRAEMLNAFNDADFYFGCGPGTSPCTLSTQNTSFGKMGAGSASAAAYSDLNTTFDPGGRMIQLVGRINF